MSYLLCCLCYVILHSGVICGLAILATWLVFFMKPELLTIRGYMVSTADNDLNTGTIYGTGDNNPVLLSGVFHHWY